LLAIAGFLVGYGTTTRNSYATDLRIYAQWCTVTAGRRRSGSARLAAVQILSNFTSVIRDEHGGEQVGGRLVASLDEVAVHIQRRGRKGVAEPACHDRDRHAGRERR